MTTTKNTAHRDRSIEAFEAYQRRRAIAESQAGAEYDDSDKQRAFMRFRI